MKWADKYRTLKIRTNADTPADAQRARDFGAEGHRPVPHRAHVLRTQRIQHMREMILAETKEDRVTALAKLLPYQREDFIGIFKAMKGLPVTIRLLDPPLHEFLPHNEKDQEELAQRLGVSPAKVKQRVAQLHEVQSDAGPSRRPIGGHLSRNSGDAGARRSSKRRCECKNARSTSCRKS